MNQLSSSNITKVRLVNDNSIATGFSDIRTPHYLMLKYVRAKRSLLQILLRTTAMVVVLVMVGGVERGWGQTTIFSENVGTPSGTTAISSYTGWQNSSPASFSGSGDVRNTTNSTGYSGASGNGNVYIAGTVNTYFQISGINTSSYSGISLTLGHFKSATAASNELKIEVSSDGTIWTQLTYTRTTGTGTASWLLITPSGTIPSTSNLRLKFTQTITTSQFRIDDIKLTGTIATAPEINIQQSGTDISTSGTYAFGHQISGTSSSVTTFTIQNTGTATLNLTGTPNKIAISGTNASEFTIDQSSTTATVAAAGTTTFTVTFSPTSQGAKTAAISIVNDDATGSENPYVLNLTGTGTGSATSDIIEKPGYTYPANIAYGSYQAADITGGANDIEIAKFTIRDGGGATDADNLPTTLNQVVVTIGNSANVRRIALYDGATEVGTEQAGAASVTFSGLSLAALDGGSKDFSARVSFKSSVTDNQKIQLTITATTSAATTGSVFALTNAGGATTILTGADDNKIAVTASDLLFNQNPTTTAIYAVMNPSPTIYAVDANVNTDLDFTGPVTLTTTGTFDSGTTTTVNAGAGTGICTFSNLAFSAAGTGLTIEGSATGVTPTGNSTTFDVTNPQPEINIKQSSSIATGGTFDFGNQVSGTSSAAVTFTIENLGTANLTLTGSPKITISGTNAAEFTINESATISPVTPSGTTTFTIAFNPTSQVPKSAAISIANNDANENPYVINLTGTGTVSTASDIVNTTGYVYTSNVDYAANQADATLATGNSVGVNGLTIRDGGATTDADNLETTLTTIAFSTGGSTAIRTAALFDGGINVAEVAVNGATTITFTGLSLTAADGGTKNFELRVTYLATVTDNQQIVFTVTSATAAITGSGFAAGNAGGAASSSSGDDNKIEVLTTQLIFSQQPSVVNSGAAMSPSVTVTAKDGNANKDLDFTDNVRITSTGTLTGTPVSIAAIGGVATFSTLTHTVPGTNLTLMAERDNSGAWDLDVSSTQFSVTAVTSATDYFQSNIAIGDWGIPSNWNSSPDNTNWIISTMVPNNSANTITIRNGHNITVNASVNVDQVVVLFGGTITYTGGTLTVNNGTGDDIVVNNGGVFTYGLSSITPTFSTGATIRINNGGVLSLQASGITGASSAIHSSSHIYDDGSILEWKLAGGLPSASGITYFPNVDEATIPIFRITSMNTSTIGGTNTTIVNGRFEIGSGVTAKFDGTGKKTFRNGILGAGNCTQNSSTCGQFLISGSTAQIGGTGTITLNANGLSISSGTTTLMSDKTINVGAISVTGTLETGIYQLAGSSPVTINNLGTLKVGSTSASGAISGNIPSGSLTLNSGSTVEFNGAGAQFAAARVFSNLRINNINGITLLGNTNINETLSLSTGVVTTSTNKVIVGVTGNIVRTSGHIYGNLERFIPNASAPTTTFDIGDATSYTPVTVTFAGTTTESGSITASTTAGDHPQIGTSGLQVSKSVNRFWTLTNSNVGGFTSYSPSFTFVTGDVDAGATPGAFVIKKFNGTNWSSTTLGSAGSLTTAATGLTSFSDFQIGELPLEATASVVSQVRCNGDANGTVTVSVSGGNLSYAYSWSTSPVQTTQAVSGLTAGTYTVTVTDGASTTATSSVIITQPEILTSTISEQTNVPCFGGNGGSATVTASGGTTSYSYRWSTSPEQTSDIASGLAVGTYTVTVTDANSCTATTSVTLTSPPEAVPGEVTGETTICSGNTSGLLSLGIHVGEIIRWQSSVDGFLNWSDIANTLDTYTSDALSVTTQFRAVVQSGGSCPEAFSTPTIVTVNPSSVGGAVTGGGPVCSGSTSGLLTLSGQSGTVVRWQSGVLIASVLTWSNIVNTSNTYTSGALTQTTWFRALVKNGSCPGVYSASKMITVNPPSVGGSIASVPAICSGSNPANLLLTGNTGSVVRWEKAADDVFTNPEIIASTSTTLTGATIGALTANTYFRAVVKSGECAAANSNHVLVTVNTPSVGGTVSGTSPVCAGNTSGELTLSGQTGSVVKWQSAVLIAAVWTWTDIPGSTNATYTSGALNESTRFRAVVQSGACPVANSVFKQITVRPNPTFSGGTVTSPNCYGEQVTFTANGLLPNVNNTFNYEVTIGSTTTTGIQNAVANASGVASYSGTGYDPGIYTFKLTSIVVAGCTTVITDPPYTPAEFTVNPAPVATVNAISNVSCFGGDNGTIDISVSSGTPDYSYAWSTSPVQTTAMATQLSAGIYTVSVTDANGCKTTASASVTEPTAPLTAGTTHTDVTLNGGHDGTATVVPSGGTEPYGYLWNDGQPTATATGLTAGTYTVTVTDANTCTTTAQAIVNQPSSFTILSAVVHVTCNSLNTGSITTTLEGGTSPFQYFWSNGQTSSAITGLTAGTYSLTVTDANQITEVGSWEVLGPGLNILGSNTACCSPGNSSVYQASVIHGCDPVTYQWVVSGGTIQSGWNTPAITVEWSCCGSGTVTLVINNCDGCIMSMTKQVDIINPPAPVITGPAVVEAGQSNTQYCTPYTYPNYYVWVVSGGSISSGQGTHCITVDWGSYPVCGCGFVAVYETGNGCEGTVNYPVTINPGNIVSLSGSVSYDNGYDTKLNGVTIQLRDASNVMVGTTTTMNNPSNGEPGYYAFTNLDNGTYSLRGSYNGTWGGNNATDALIVQLQVIGAFNPPIGLAGMRLLAADANASTTVSGLDALYIKLRTIGSISSYPGGDWIVSEEPVILTGSPVTKNVTTICTGDANGSFIPVGYKETPLLSVVDDGLVSVPVGEPFVYSIRSSREALLGAMTLFMGYDNERFEVVDVGGISEDMKYAVGDGTISIAWADTKPMTVKTDDLLLSLNLRLKHEITEPANVFTLRPGSEFADIMANPFDNFELKMAKVVTPGTQELSMYNYPNPFKNTTTILYTLPEAGHVNLVLTDLYGKTMATLADGPHNAGSHSVTVDPAALHLTPGVYLYKIIFNNSTDTEVKVNKMVFTR